MSLLSPHTTNVPCILAFVNISCGLQQGLQPHHVYARPHLEVLALWMLAIYPHSLKPLAVWAFVDRHTR